MIEPVNDDTESVEFTISIFVVILDPIKVENVRDCDITVDTVSDEVTTIVLVEMVDPINVE